MVLFLFQRDNVTWNDEQEKHAFECVQKNSQLKMAPETIEKYENEASNFWNDFYDIHQNKFFKDRHWLFTEFPELKTTSCDIGHTNIFEIGCGVGNTIFPILKYNSDPNLRVFGCDFSPRAIDILKENKEFDAKRCQVFVLDATDDVWEKNIPFEENSMDIVVMIFVLSAIKPEKYMHTNTSSCIIYNQ